MNPPGKHILPQAFAGHKSHNTSGDPGREWAPGPSLDPRSPSALRADLYVDGRFWATVQLPARSPLVALAQALSAESYHQSWQLQDDMIALDAAWTHLSLHLCRPIRTPSAPLSPEKRAPQTQTRPPGPRQPSKETIRAHTQAPTRQANLTERSTLPCPESALS